MKKYIAFLLLFGTCLFYRSDVDAAATNIFDAPVIAYHTYLMEMTPLTPQAVNDGAAMPDALVVPSGRYKAYGQTYDMTQEGLYRFFNHGDLTTIQRIVYSSNPIALISSMQWIFTQSYVDNSLYTPTMTNLTNKAKYDKLRVSCGIAVEYMAWLMPQYGFPARYAGTITNKQWNYVNDGHAMVEIYLDGKWVLFDPAFNTRFWRDGIPLSLLEVASDLSTVEIEYMAFDTSYDVSGLWYQGHSFASLFEPMMSPELLRDYYGRVFGSLIIRLPGTLNYYYYDSGGHDAEYQGWGWFKIPQAEWNALLYP